MAVRGKVHTNHTLVVLTDHPNDTRPVAELAKQGAGQADPRARAWRRLRLLQAVSVRAQVQLGADGCASDILRALSRWAARNASGAEQVTLDVSVQWLWCI